MYSKTENICIKSKSKPSLSIYRSIYLFIYLPIYLQCIYLPTDQINICSITENKCIKSKPKPSRSLYVSLYLCIHLFIYLSIYPSNIYPIKENMCIRSKSKPSLSLYVSMYLSKYPPITYIFHYGKYVYLVEQIYIPLRKICALILNLKKQSIYLSNYPSNQR